MDNKKILFAGAGAFLLLVIAMVFVFYSNSKKANPGTGKSEENKIVFWDYSDNEKSFRNMINNFQTENNIKVEYVVKNPEEYLEDSLNEIAAGKGPDVWTVPNDWLPKYKDKMVAMPEDKMADSKTKTSSGENYKKNYARSIAFDNIIGDKIYGVPIIADKLVLICNETVFGQKVEEYRRTHLYEFDSPTRKLLENKPKNWEDFTTVSRYITEKDGQNIKLSGTALGATENNPSAVDVLTLMMMQNGAQMTAEDFKTAAFHIEKARFGNLSYPGTKALEFFTSFANKDSDNYSWNSGMTDTYHAFAEGKLAMLIDYESSIAKIKKINDKVQFSVFDVPQIKETSTPVNMVSYPTYTVTKASKNPNKAWDFILNITSNQNSNQFAVDTQKTTARIGNRLTEEFAKTTMSWYKPDPVRGDEIFATMIKQVNDGSATQTAIENAASQITDLLQKISQ